MITNFDQLSAMTALLTNEELNALAEKCENLVKDRERIERKELQDKFTENLEILLNDILSEKFTLIIENVDNPNYVLRLNFDEDYYIKIE